MKHTVTRPSDTPHRSPAAAHGAARSSTPVSTEFMDNRPEAVAQRRLADMIHNSPAMVAQRQQLRGMFGETAQLMGEPQEEELVQGKFAVVQHQGSPEEEELLQGKFKPVQLQRKCESVSTLQRKQKSAQPDASMQLSTGNTGLPDNLKSGIESLSGLAINDVRVHYNSAHPAQLNALAYTQGTDIHVAPGQEQYLPHEAWHVVQQAQGRVQPTMQLKDGVLVNDDQGLEHEADVMGERASQARGESVQFKRSTDTVLLSATSAYQLVRPISNRTGTVVQREKDQLGSIQIVLSGGVITNSHISTNERPEGSMKGEEGSHTTAWVVTVEGIRQAIQGKTIAEAITKTNELYSLAKTLPGVGRVTALSKERRDTLTEIEGKVDTNKTAATLAPSLDTLQEYIGALMAYRNALPLSAAKRGALANSDSEGRSIATLRNYQAEQASRLRAAIFKLIDKKAVADFQANAEFFQDQDDITKEVSIDNPGSVQTENVNQRVIDIIQQHLMWVQGLFPAAYAKAAISKDHILDEFLFHDDESEIDFGDREDIESLFGVGTVPGIPNNPVPANLTPSNDRFSAQVVLSDADPKKVALVIIAGRPQGVFGSQDRKHTTAWGVFVRGVKGRTEGKTLLAAVDGIKSLLAEAKAMPGAQGIQSTAMSDQATKRFTDKLTSADTAQTAAVNAVRGNNLQVKHNALQLFIHAYLSCRNAMPLTAAKIDSQVSTAGGKAEARRLGTMDKFEETGSRLSPSEEKLAAVAAFWGLFDFGVLKVMNANPPWQSNTAGVTFSTNMPGVNKDVRPTQRVVNVIVQHVLTMRSAYPQTVDRLKVPISKSLHGKLAASFNDENTTKRVANTIRIEVGWPTIL